MNTRLAKYSGLRTTLIGLITEDSDLHLHINTEPASAAGREGDDPDMRTKK